MRERCPACPYKDNPLVRGKSSGKSPTLMVIGEAPGNEEVIRGQPFIGESGRLLRQTLQAVGVDLKDVYFTNACICHPTGNATPTSEMISSCRPGLIDEISEVKPRKILTVGATSLQSLLGDAKSVGITKTHGQGMIVKISDDLEVFVVPTFHPAYILRSDDVFRSFAYDIEKWFKQEKPLSLPEVEIEIPDTPLGIYDALDTISNASGISCDLETSGFDPNEDLIYSIGFGALKSDGTGYSVIIKRELIYNSAVQEYVRNLFSSFQGPIAFHNGKFDMKFIWTWLGEADLTTWPQNFQDTMLLNYCRDERGGSDEDRKHSGNQSEHGLKTISRIRYDIPDYKFNFDKFNEIPPEERDWDSLYYYHALDCYQTIRLWWDVTRELDEESPKLREVHDKILSPGSKALSRAESRGILVDEDHLKRLDEKYTNQANELEDFCRGFLSKRGIEVSNLGSPKEMVGVLFDKLNLPGERTTEKESLLFLTTKVDEEMKEFLEQFLNYRTVKKMISNYVHGLLNSRDRNGRIHPDFQIHGARTGRMSARRPAVQTIPTLFGPDIRRAFIPTPGYVWVDADESQLELRVAAYLSQDEAMIRAYQEDRDIHREVAAAMFKKPPEEITDYERYLAKYIDFGVIYQRTAMAVATGWEMTYAELKYGQKKWTTEEAQFFIDEFLGGFPGLQKWLEDQKNRVNLPEVFAETATGFRRRFPFVSRRNRSGIQRQLVNSPIQGFASHITFSGLGRIQEEFFRKWPGGAYVLMTVHDSIGSEVHKDLIGEVIPIIKSNMEIAPVPNFNVPLRSDFKVGHSWGEAIEVKSTKEVNRVVDLLLHQNSLLEEIRQYSGEFPHSLKDIDKALTKMGRKVEDRYVPTCATVS